MWARVGAWVCGRVGAYGRVVAWARVGVWACGRVSARACGRVGARGYVGACGRVDPSGCVGACDSVGAPVGVWARMGAYGLVCVRVGEWARGRVGAWAPVDVWACGRV